MILWLLIIMLCSAVTVALSMPLIRRSENLDGINHNALAFYHDQLKEIDRDMNAGTINAPEAATAKLEIQRRLNVAQKNQPVAAPLPAKFRQLTLISTASLIIIGSLGLYSMLGHPNLTPTTSTAASPDEVNAMIAKLVARAKANPGDAEGWRMLGWAQFTMQHYSEAVEAYSKASGVDPTNSDYKSAWAEALVLEAQDAVTPKAQALFSEVLNSNPKDPRARFYDALSHEQSGDQSGALDRLIALLADSPADASWRANVEQRIADLAKATGRDVSKLFMPSPSADQKSQIQALPEADQNALIASMVERLATRLSENPNDLEGWINLMRSYQVLKQPDKAKDALTKALTAFANDSAGQDKIKAAAKELGVEL